MALERDERQEWTTLCRRIAEQTKIMHDELARTGMDEELVKAMTHEYFTTSIGYSFRPNLGDMLAGILPVKPDDDEDDAA
jgi:hypothetical protein